MSNSDITKHDCDKNSDLFCYVCGKYEVQKNQGMINDKIKDVYERGFHTQYVVLVITCLCSRKNARTGKISNMTNLQYGNNREAQLTVIFGTQMIVLASIERHGPKFSMLKFCLQERRT